MKIGLLFFTPNGELIANKLMDCCDDEFVIYNKHVQTAKEFVKEHFSLDALVFIGATGIAVRLIAPHIKSKDIDPAVVVIDEHGLYLIPMLSGHIGGANELAITLATKLGATPVITTATDLNGVFAVDVWSRKSNCELLDIKMIKHCSSALLSGEDVGFVSDFEYDNLPKGVLDSRHTKVGIVVSTSETQCPFEKTLNVIPRIVRVGVGCKKGTDTIFFEEYLLQTLKEQDISIKSITQIASIDLKREEACILNFCKKYHLTYNTYTASELASVYGQFTSSEFVRRITGVDNVCERSAMIGMDAQLRLKKQSKDGMTVAIAQEKWRCEF